MVKLFVVAPDDGEARLPFMRGILTRSLQDAGLSFDDAYAVSGDVRKQFEESTEITTAQLRKAVVEKIAQHGPVALDRYQHPLPQPGAILVRDAYGHTSPFSREQHRRTLESSGLCYEDSTEVTTSIFGYLMEKELKEIPARQLGFLTYRNIRTLYGSEAARRYLVLMEFLQKRHPIVLLIGGAPGTGKSAVATEIAQRLEIVRIQSTDLLREVMRVMLPERLLPVLHRSSYDAWLALPGDAEGIPVSDAGLVAGYRAQAELLSVPCEAVIARSLRESASLILEGVHVQPGMAERIPTEPDVIVIPIMLAAANPESLRSRFRGRGEQSVHRRAERYLTNFYSIWRLQAHLLSEADRCQIPVIVNDSRERVVQEVMATIVRTLQTQLSAKPTEVFV